MEFPDSEKHCSVSACLRSDFLLNKCDTCEQFFCSKHICYAEHSCPALNKLHTQDIVVPVPVDLLCTDPYFITPHLSRTDHDNQKFQEIQHSYVASSDENSEISPNLIFMNNQFPVNHIQMDQDNIEDEALEISLDNYYPDLIEEDENENPKNGKICSNSDKFWTIMFIISVIACAIRWYIKNL